MKNALGIIKVYKFFKKTYKTLFIYKFIVLNFFKSWLMFDSN